MKYILFNWRVHRVVPEAHLWDGIPPKRRQKTQQDIFHLVAERRSKCLLTTVIVLMVRGF